MPKKVIFIELNEVTWRLIDPLIEAGKLPTFAYLKSNSLWATPESVEKPPQMDPWITWTTVYTGQPQSVHGVFHLQQPPESIRAPRIWEIAHKAGLKVGVYGSLCSYPPKDIGAFFVPDTFSPDFSTFPNDLEPIQKLNLTYTRSIRLESDEDGISHKAKLGARLLGLGLKIGTGVKVANQLVDEFRDPNVRWKRVALQPAVNFDFFERLYRRHLPDLAMFHTNHVAHYQHTYWKAMQPELFPQPTSDEERKTYSGAIEHGYLAADRLLKRALDLCDEDTVLVVASSMGQQPYISQLERGKRIGQLRSLEAFAKLIGANGNAKFLSVMSDQFNVYTDDPEERDRLAHIIGTMHVDVPEQPLFDVAKMDGFLTVTLNHSDKFGDSSECVGEIDGNTHRWNFTDLVYTTGNVKSGCHHPDGILMIHGSRAAPGEISDSSNLDVAPTLLSLLGLPVPKHFSGRVLVDRSK